MSHLARFAPLASFLPMAAAPGQTDFESLDYVRGAAPAPGFVEAADMNGDGLTDVVVGSSELASGEVTPMGLSVSIAYGRPDGSFEPGVSVMPTAAPLRAMDVADIDGDGDQDIAIVRSSGPASGIGIVQVWLQNGGVYTIEASVNVGYSLLECLEIIDVDGDGILDVFISSGRGDASSGFTGGEWLRRDGAGGLSGPMAVTTSGFSTSRTRLVDLDHDGDLDVVVAGSSIGGSQGAYELGWFENTSGFPIDYANGAGLPWGTGSAADFVAFDADQDGDTDLAVLSYHFSSTSSLRLLLNDGSGTMTTAPPYEGPVRGLQLRASDLDLDGDEDLVCIGVSGTFGSYRSDPTYMLNDGAGAFTGATTFGQSMVAAQAVEAADLDGDGFPEVLIAARRSGAPNPDGTPTVAIHRNRTGAGGTGAARFAAPFNVVETFGGAPLHWADFNGDGRPDLCVQAIYGDSEFAAVKLARAEGDFGAAIRVADVAPLGETQQGGPAAGDIDGDGHADVVFLSPDRTSVQATLGDGSGGFGPAITLTPWNSDADFIELHDLDEDGDLDLLGTRVAGTRLLMSLGDGAGGFTAPTSLGGGFPGALRFQYVDVDGDQRRDLLTSVGADIEWMRGLSGVGFASRITLATLPNPVGDLASGDLDGDGVLDVAASEVGDSGGSTRSIFALFGTGAGAFAPLATVASLSGGWASIAALDLDLDGDGDLVAARARLGRGLDALTSIGNQSFASPVPLDMRGAPVRYLSNRDLDLDGDEDLVVGVDSVAALAVLDARANRSLGTPYCIGAVPNSTGRVGSLIAIGSGEVADNRLWLTSSDLPTQSFGYYLASLTTGYASNVPGSMGVLCLGGEIGRFVGADQVQQSGVAGAFSLDIDLTMIPQPNGLVTVAAGSTWHFQGWHRDADSTGQPTSNFTEAVIVQF